MTSEEHRLEAALRRKAKRHDLQLKKSRARNPQLPWHGTYCLVDPFRNALEFGDHNSGYGMSLHDIAQYLKD